MLRLGAFHFKALPTLITLLAIAFLVKLGFWQLDRAAEKQKLFDDFAIQQQTPLDISQPSETLPVRFRSVKATGIFDSERYLLRDNQMHDGKVGYQVIALLKVETDVAFIPVNLGWVPAPVLRSELPAVDIPAG
ncbi:SURF1 family protein, partial [Thalassospira xiamenensis]